MKSIKELWEKLDKVELVQVRPEEMEPMYRHCFEFNKPRIVEIGSAHGASSIIFSEAVRELGGHLTCIDSYPENYYNQEKFGSYAKRQFLKNIKPYNEFVTFINMPSEEAVKELLPLKISILFIDGSHEYKDVANDCKNYLPFLASGGYVGFHDYNNVAFDGVKKAADEYTTGWESESYWDLVIRKKP